MRKLIIDKENKRTFLGIGGEKRKNKPYILPTRKNNYVAPADGKIQRASILVAPRIAKNENLGKQATEQPTTNHILYEEAALSNLEQHV